MTFFVTCTPEFDIHFHLVRQAIRCLLRIIEYFMSTECPWLIVQGDCNLHKSLWLAASNEVNLIAKKSVKLLLFQNLLRYFCTLQIFFKNISVLYWLIPRETLIITTLIIHSILKIFQNDLKWPFYPSQVSNELLFVWFTDFLHIERFKSVTYGSITYEAVGETAH